MSERAKGRKGEGEKTTDKNTCYEFFFCPSLLTFEFCPFDGAQGRLLTFDLSEITGRVPEPDQD
jgi:hypothetical protein